MNFFRLHLQSQGILCLVAPRAICSLFLLLTRVSESSWSQSRVTLHRLDVKRVHQLFIQMNSPAMFGFTTEVLFAGRQVNFFLNTCGYLPTGIKSKISKRNTQYWCKYPQHRLTVKQSVGWRGERKQTKISFSTNVDFFYRISHIGMMLCNKYKLCANRNLFQITD